MVRAVFRARQEREQAAMDHRITQAWLTARLGMSDPKTFPELETLTGAAKPRRQQTPEESMHNLLMWGTFLSVERED